VLDGGAGIRLEGLALTGVDGSAGHAVMEATASCSVPSITSVRLPVQLTGILAMGETTASACPDALLNVLPTGVTPTVDAGTWFASSAAAKTELGNKIPLLIELDVGNATCLSFLEAHVQGNVQTASLTRIRTTKTFPPGA